MPRFDKLEFSPSPEDSKAASESPPRERDEAYWMQQAVEHRRNGHYENALRFYSRALEQDKSLTRRLGRSGADAGTAQRVSLGGDVVPHGLGPVSLP